MFGADLELQTDNDGVTIAPGTASVEIVDNDGEARDGVWVWLQCITLTVRVWHQYGCIASIWTWHQCEHGFQYGRGHKWPQRYLLLRLTQGQCDSWHYHFYHFG